MTVSIVQTWLYMCTEIFARKHTGTNKPTSDQPLIVTTMTHINRLWGGLRPSGAIKFNFYTIIYENHTVFRDVPLESAAADVATESHEKGNLLSLWSKKILPFLRVGSCWVFIANTLFPPHQQSVFQSTTFRPDCWCGGKRVLAMNTQQEPPLKQDLRYRYGEETVNLIKSYERCVEKLARYKNHVVLLPSSCFLVTLDTLRLIHKTPTSTPNVKFPQLRRDDAPHLPDSSRMSTGRFKKVGIFFFSCLLENGWGNPVETSCFETLTAGVVGREY